MNTLSAGRRRDCGDRDVVLPLVSREWKTGISGSYNCTPFLHSLLTKGKCLGYVDSGAFNMFSRLSDGFGWLCGRIWCAG